MKFTTSEIPQADKLSKVVQTVEAVNEGAATEDQIAEYIGFSDRQARYYRHAAEILGFISNHQNNATISDAGRTLVNSDEDSQNKILKQALYKNALYNELIKYFEINKKGIVEEELKQFLLSISDNDAQSTIPRRVRTVISWLTHLEVVFHDEDENNYKYNDKVEFEFEENTGGESIYPSDKYSQEVDIKEDKFSVYELVRKINQKKIIMNPEFQRNLVWKPHQKSQFIESIILNIPLPPLYFKKELDGKYTIVDGLQRTSTLKAFIEKEGEQYFPLVGLQALPKLNGKYFDGLNDDEKTRIEDKNLLVYIIQPSVPMVVVYDIFNRINTGGTQLDRQEIRNCIFIGESTKLLKKLAETDDFKVAIDYGIAPTRMKDREAILRCLAFEIFDYEKEYNNSVDEFLEKAMKKINKMTSSEISKLESNFLRVMKITFDFFQNENFRLPTQFSRGRINIAVFESVYLFFAKRDNKLLKKNKEQIIDNYRKLFGNVDYYDSVRYSTGSKTKVKTRFELVEEILGDF